MKKRLFLFPMLLTLLLSCSSINENNGADTENGAIVNATDTAGDEIISDGLPEKDKEEVPRYGR